MNPDLVLPIFLAVVVLALCVWNVVMTGTIRDLQNELDVAEDSIYAKDKEISDYIEAIQILNSKIPKRGKGGRFRSKS